MSIFRTLRPLLGALALAGLLAGCPAGSEKPFPHAIVTAEPRQALPEVRLVNADGKPFTPQDLKGKWVWLYFGFANCPDVCPAAMDYMAAEYKQLAHPERVTPVFVSVDPGRDTPARLKTFTHYYSPAILGVTGDKAALDTLTKAVGAGYVIDQPAKPGGDYNVSHTNMIFVVDPEGRWAASYVPSPQGGVMAKDFDTLVAQTPQP